ncbi:MAG TPA: Fur family transcriptional regulator [Acidimicrobiia bacterium]|nr:Fur family transcriptional regulator [Acidimicrobiia bacterium]
MPATTDELVDSLRRSGLRVTAPRRAVCHVLASASDELLSATDLAQRVQHVLGRTVDLATIYRTIEVLEREGHVHHVHFGDGPGVVHMVEGSLHQHLVCENCGRTENVPLHELRGLTGGLEERYGFVAGSSHFALMGLCRNCRE